MGASHTALWKTNLDYNDDPANYGFGTAASLLGQIDQPGVVRDDYDASFGQRWFRFVSLDANSANVIAGDVVGFKTNNTSNALVTSNTTSTRGKNAVAGVATSNITAGNYGWIQVAGFHSGVNTTGATVGNDDVLVASATDKVATNIADGNAITQVILGQSTANTANLTPAVLRLAVV